MRKTLKRTSSIVLAALMTFLMVTPVMAIEEDWEIQSVISQGPNAFEVGVQETISLPYKIVDGTGKEVTLDSSETITWKVEEESDEGVVSLSDNGVVTGQQEGEVRISATLSNDANLWFTVTVVDSQSGSDDPTPGPGPDGPPAVEAESLYFLDVPDNAQEYSIPYGAVPGVQIRNYINTVPAEAAYNINDVQIVSSDPEVIDRDPSKPDGLQIKKVGEAEITITYKGKSDTRKFFVTEGGMMFESFGPEGNNQVTFSDTVSTDNQNILGGFLKHASLYMGIVPATVKEGLVASGADIEKKVAYVSFRIHVSKCEEDPNTGEMLLTMDITPQYRYTQGEGEMTEFNIAGPFTMRIPINETFYKTAPKIQHKHDGKTYTYQGEFEVDATRNIKYVKFTNEHGFSEFTIGATEEEETTPASSDKVPQTGDHNNMTGWIVLMAAVVAIGSGTVIYSKKRKTNK